MTTGDLTGEHIVKDLDLIENKGESEGMCSQKAVGARLLKFAHICTSSGAEPWITSVLSIGNQIPFLIIPPLARQPKALTAYQPGSERFLALQDEVIKLLGKEAIVPVLEPDTGYYNRLFVVPKATGGWKTVLDVSTLNTYVDKTSFSMETPHSVLKHSEEEISSYPQT